MLLTKVDNIKKEWRSEFKTVCMIKECGGMSKMELKGHLLEDNNEL